MKTILLMIVLVSSRAISFGQSNEPDSSTYELGIGTNIILPSIMRETPFSIMFKTTKKEKTALRLGLSALIQVTDINGARSPSIPTYLQKSYLLNLVIGFEKRQYLHRKWKWSYGGDVIPNYSYTRNESQPGTAAMVSFTLNETVGIIGRPFIGFQFHVSPKFYLATEFACNASYSKQKNQEENYYNDTISVNQTTDQFSLSFAPASSIFIFYKF